jgi:hypothetical protein
MLGQGTEQYPYLIENADDWRSLSSIDTTGNYFKLINDIFNITEIQNFYGLLDGNGKTINKRFIINNYGVIENVIYNNPNAVTSNNVGSNYSTSLFVRNNQNSGIIRNCHVNANVNKDLQDTINNDTPPPQGSLNVGYISGFCESNDGIIENCSFKGKITAFFHSLTISGFCSQGTGAILNCYGDLTITAIAIAPRISGLCHSSDSTVKNSYVKLKVTIIDLWSQGDNFSNYETSHQANLWGLAYKSIDSISIIEYIDYILNFTPSTNYKYRVGHIVENCLGQTIDNPKNIHLGTIGLNERGGLDFEMSDFENDGTFGGRFLPENGWIVENGKLPLLGFEGEDGDDDGDEPQEPEPPLFKRRSSIVGFLLN